MSIPIGPSGKTERPGGGRATGSKSSEWASWILIGLAVAAVVVLAVSLTTSAGQSNDAGETNTATSADADSGGAAAVAVDGETMTFEVDVQGMLFVPNRVEVPAGTELILEVTNSDSMQHDLQIRDAETGLIRPGETVTLEAGVFTESVQGTCTVAGHEAMGMTFDVVVTDDPGGENAPAGADALTNPLAHVPTLAERTVDHEGFEPFDPVLPPAPTGTVHEHEWTITEEIRQIAPGHEQVVWLFDGQAPGPTLRGTVGDTFRITLHNEGTMDHSVDFHAGEVNPDEHMAQIPVGESLTYEFVAHRSGIWMYHCATLPMSLHIANGMVGAVVIDPPADSDEALSDVDEEYLLVAHEMFLGDPDVGADAQRVSDGQYDLTGFNWYPNQYNLAPLEHRVGDTVRMWLMNVGPDNPLSFHVVGESFDTVWSEGDYLIRDAGQKGTGSQAVSLLAAQGGFVEFTFDEPGTYVFVNHQMTDAEKGQRGSIVVTE